MGGFSSMIGTTAFFSDRGWETVGTQGVVLRNSFGMAIQRRVAFAELAIPEHDCVCGRPVQLLQHAPLLRQAVCRVVQGAHQVQGHAFGLAGASAGELIEG